MSISGNHAGGDAEAALGDRVVIDLSDPPSREDLGVPDDRTTYILERDDGTPFDVTVRFSDGRELSTSAVHLAVRTSGPGTAPYDVELARRDMTLDDLRDALESAVSDLGADADLVESVLSEAEFATDRDADLKRVIPTDVGYPDSLELQPIVTAMEGRVSISYEVSWEAP